MKQTLFRWGMGLAAATIVAALGPSSARAWVKRLDQGQAPDETANAVAYDSARDAVVAAGVLGEQFAVVQLDAQTGTLRWERQLPGTASTKRGRAAAVVLDAAGDVYAAGYVDNAGSGQDLAVAKIDGSNGTIVWARFIDGAVGVAAGLQDGASAVALDGAGGLFVAGSLDRLAPNYGDYVALKFDAQTGTTLWEYSIDGSMAENANTYYDSVRAIAVDSSGHPVLLGVLLSTTSVCNGLICFDIVITKVDGANGAEIWRTTLDWSSEDIPRTVELDALDNVYWGGFVINQGRSLTVGKLAAQTGNTLWTYFDQATNISYSSAHALAIDTSGDVFVAGSVDEGATGIDFAALRLAGSSGSVVWRRTFDGGQGLGDDAFDLLVEPGGDVIVGGRAQTGSAAGRSMSVRKLTAAAGTTLWHSVITGSSSAGGNQQASALTLGGGKVLVGGQLTAGPSGRDLTVVGLDPLDGSGGTTPLFLLDRRPLLVRAELRIWPYRDARALKREIKTAMRTDPTLRGAVYARSADDLLRYPDRTVLFVPARDAEVAFYRWLRKNHRRVDARSAPAHIFFVDNGAGAEVLARQERRRSR